MSPQEIFKDDITVRSYAVILVALMAEEGFGVHELLFFLFAATLLNDIVLPRVFPRPDLAQCDLEKRPVPLIRSAANSLLDFLFLS